MNAIKQLLKPFLLPLYRYYLNLPVESKIILISALVFAVLVFFITLVGFYEIFDKAGQRGWAAIVPIYRSIVLLHIVEESGAKILLFFIPIVNLVYYYYVLIKLSKSFGKPGSFAAGLFLLPVVFFLVLGFGNNVCLTAKEKETDDYWTIM